MIIFPFSQKLKRIQKYEKKDKLFILSELLLTLGANKLVF